MEKQDIERHYAKERDICARQIERQNQQSRMIVAAEIVAFLAAIVMIALYAMTSATSWTLYAAVILIVFYLAMRWIDVCSDRRKRKLQCRKTVFDNELSYFHGDFSPFDSGERYINPRHAYTFDLDIFGKGLLFQRIDRTVTTGGSDTLASRLSTLPHDCNEVNHQSEAIDELSQHSEWMIEFLSRGQNLKSKGTRTINKIETKNITDAATRIKQMPQHSRLCSMAVRLTVIVSIAVLIVLAIMGIHDSRYVSIAFIWSSLQLIIALLFCSQAIKEMTITVDILHAEMQPFISLVRHIHSEKFNSRQMKELQTRLFSANSDALKAFESLSSILEGINRRSNFVGLMLFNMLYMSDFFLVRSFLKWKSLYTDHINIWADAVSQIDALVSMAMLQHNNPDTIKAEISDIDGIMLYAKGLRHPFLREQAVSNDFEITERNYYIITGANMAGKSTFLRAIGINYVLAMNGVAVFADSFRVSMFSLFSSMRTSDDISHGISYFNAELLRLQQLIYACQHSRHTLIILDEILKGTNSMDKLNGSRMFLEEISAWPVSGVIATHDLELSRMEETHAERFHNYCFEIELADPIMYSYKITRGVARNQNATYLLRKMLKSASNQNNSAEQFDSID